MVQNDSRPLPDSVVRTSAFIREQQKVCRDSSDLSHHHEVHACYMADMSLHGQVGAQEDTELSEEDGEIKSFPSRTGADGHW